jgi:ammonia channel protein AmtB
MDWRAVGEGAIAGAVSGAVGGLVVTFLSSAVAPLSSLIIGAVGGLISGAINTGVIELIRQSRNE